VNSFTTNLEQTSSDDSELIHYQALADGSSGDSELNLEQTTSSGDSEIIHY
jgi:hypothetical protein